MCNFGQPGETNLRFAKALFVCARSRIAAQVAVISPVVRAELAIGTVSGGLG